MRFHLRLWWIMTLKFLAFVGICLLSGMAQGAENKVGTAKATGPSSKTSLSSTPTVGPSTTVTDKYIEELKIKARELKLGDQRAWLKILMMPDRTFGNHRSLVDDSRYFLSKNGKTNPRQELESMLDALAQPATFHAPGLEQHPRCIFTARYTWLQKKLDIKDGKLPTVSCQAYQEFREYAHYAKVSLVFSNYYLNNPASMFGHTFLRLHKQSKDDDGEGLLDDLLNFSAMIPDSPEPWYPIKGMMGGYQGKFLLLPYYKKLQEYSNYESRDLWEYELNLTPEEISFFAPLIWELGWFNIDYYYLDDNCSGVLLSVLEAVKPDLEATEDAGFYVVPLDTLHAVLKYPGLLKDKKYRPSILSRYVYRARDLEGSLERKVFVRLMNEQHPDLDVLFKGCDKNCEARVIDAALDYMDFSEKIAGSNHPMAYKDLRLNLMKRRSGNPVKPVVLTDRKPLSESPVAAHPSGWLAVGTGRDHFTKESFNQLHWRPALHEWGASHGGGFAAGTDLAFMDTKIRFDQKHAKGSLESMTLISILSLPPAYPLVERQAWQLRIGYEQLSAYKNPKSVHKRTGVVGGVGKSIFWGQHTVAFGLINLDGGWDQTDRTRLSLDPRLTFGLKQEWSSWGTMTFTMDLARYSSRQPEDILASHLNWALSLGKVWESRIAVSQLNRKEVEAMIGLGRYF